MGRDVLSVYDADCNFLVTFDIPSNFHLLGENDQQRFVSDALQQNEHTLQNKALKQVEGPDMPDVSKLPEREFRAGKYHIRFLKDCRSIKQSFSRLTHPRYIYVMVAVDTVEREFVYYVSIERADGSGSVAREFNEVGNGQRVTRTAKWEDETVFVHDSLALMAERLNVRII